MAMVSKPKPPKRAEEPFDQGADGRPNHHHGHGQALADRLLTVDGHLRG